MPRGSTVRRRAPGAAPAPPAANRSITVSGGSLSNSIITSGDGNTVIVYQTVAAVATQTGDGRNPYVGMLAFTEADASRFFGRDEQVTKLWTRYRDLAAAAPDQHPMRFLAILGPSGSGKSSLARAGLLAELARRPVGGKSQRVAALTPGPRPLEALASVLARIGGPDGAVMTTRDDYLQDLAKGPGGLRRIAETLGAPASPLLVLVDQFEEIYSLCQDEGERRTFVAALLEAAGDRGRAVSVVVTLRTDFLGATQADSELNHAIAGQNLLVPAMQRSELHDAIAQPAKQAGRPLQESTIEQLVNETIGRDGALPLLQFVLVKLWEGGPDDYATLQALGGVGGAVGREAQRIFDGLDGEQKAIAQRAFLAMVQFNENMRPTRDRATLKRLVIKASGQSDEQALQNLFDVLNRFAQPDARLVTMSATSAGEQTAEVTHEAIFEYWPLLKQWLIDGRDDIRLHQRAREAAGLWAEGHGSLWRSPELDQLRALSKKPTVTLSDVETAFLDASDKEATKLKRRSRMVLAAGLLLTAFALTIGAVAVNQSLRAERQQSTAYAASAEQALAQGDTGRALLLALEATPPGRADRPGFERASGVLRAALLNLAELRTLQHPKAVLEALFAAGDGRALTLDGSFTARLWDLDTGRVLLSLPRTDGIAVSPEGARLATWGSPEGVRLWDAINGAPRAVIQGQATSVSFGPDGRLAIAWGGGRQDFGDGVRTELSGAPPGVWSDRGAALRLLGPPGFRADKVGFSPDGRFVATVIENGPLQVWDAVSGAPVGQPLDRDVGEQPQTPLLSPDGRYLALEELGDGTLKVWNVPEGRLIKSLKAVNSPSFSRRFPRMAVAALDGTEIIDLTTGEDVLRQKDQDLSLTSVEFAPDGRAATTSFENHTVDLWEIAGNGEFDRLGVLTGHTARIGGASFSKDGDRILSYGEDGSARLWRSQTGPPIHQLAASSSPSRASWANGGARFIWRSAVALSVYDLSTGRPVAAFGFLGNVFRPTSAISPDGRVIAYEDEGPIVLWDGVKALSIASPSKATVQSMAFTRDGARLVVAYADRVTTFNARTGKADPAVLRPATGTSFFHWAAVARDGRILAAEDSGAARIWTPSTGRVLPLGPHNGQVEFAAFSHDGRRAITLSADRRARIWDTANGHLDFVMDINAKLAAFSPDDRLIATMETAGPAKLWDAATGEHLMDLPNYINGGDWSPDGRRFVGVNEYKPEPLLVDVPARFGRELRAEACRRKPRDFTGEERRIYHLTAADPCRSSWLQMLGLGG